MRIRLEDEDDATVQLMTRFYRELVASPDSPQMPREVQITAQLEQELCPAFSPDGLVIAFSYNEDGEDDFDIFIRQTETDTSLRLTDSAHKDLYPTWSPDGDRLAFWSNRDGDGEIYVMDVDGGRQTNLTNDPSANDGWPAWGRTWWNISVRSMRRRLRRIRLCCCAVRRTGSWPVGLSSLRCVRRGRRCCACRWVRRRGRRNTSFIACRSGPTSASGRLCRCSYALRGRTLRSRGGAA